jgi:TatD DNase family protein
LTPAQRKGKKNEPAFVRYTAEEVAGLRNISLEAVAEITSENVLKAFRLGS